MKRSQMLKDTLKKSKIPTDAYRKQQKKKERKKKKQEWSEQLEKLVRTKNPHDVKEKLDSLRIKEQQGKLLHVEKKKLKQYETLWNLIKEKVKDGSYFYSNNGVVFSMSEQHGEGAADGAVGGDSERNSVGKDNFSTKQCEDSAADSESDYASSDIQVSSESSHENDGSSSVQSDDLSSSQGNDLEGPGENDQEEDFFLESLPSLPKGLPDEFIIPNMNAHPNGSYYPNVNLNSYPCSNTYPSYQAPIPFNATGQNSSCYAYGNSGYYGGYPNGLNFYFGSGYPATYVHGVENKSCLDRQDKKEKTIPTDDKEQHENSENCSKDKFYPSGEDKADPSSPKLSYNITNVSNNERQLLPEGDTTLSIDGTKDVNASMNAHGDCPAVCANPDHDEGEKNSTHDGVGNHLSDAEIDSKASEEKGGIAQPPPPGAPPSGYGNNGTNNSFIAPSYGTNYYYNYAHMYGNFNMGQMNGGNYFIPTNNSMAMWGTPNLRGGHGYVGPSRNYGDRGKRHSNHNRGRGGNPASKKARMGANGANYGFPVSQPDDYDQSGRRGNVDVGAYGKRGQGGRRTHQRQRHQEDRITESSHGKKEDPQPSAQYFVPINLRLKNKLNDLCETKINEVKKETNANDKNINLDVEYSKFIKEVNLG
ncbi:WW domain-binding protein 11, putative [Plasmodium knowlesi strain H]|uniref:WW domain-binding protein 11, putative n=3 Tax=Plasmodium knowlesi TaxID=5850 RepID=A0A5K1VA82_PLAKH|nr:WW domain-binding protein 11, putative [Plasmodium knowlesi strain H]OTN67609.1 putative WW domain-binding protein 11 [Plasmodium knowlesi]CAA9990342.1 WW domain-binding protein 11, putative [Plasmodium knowlesi strain H]SBO19548.1 WW domain-binding protein 11, putative [Plasmodium knowlesi strain H]SBO22737.1 WW domain-binding protein 11, putative [Plasmodium knowlesi strain H]VVS79816.1 WW domain-binding protein 11, putative [Plasmodium knowlesi strain H]|eukprot:XP_002260744.1 hypothetical protein, conserved in Plasmodium species [Plasmodium knowlesi strain H]